jgi:hypothetical protein
MKFRIWEQIRITFIALTLNPLDGNFKEEKFPVLERQYGILHKKKKY